MGHHDPGSLTPELFRTLYPATAGLFFGCGSELSILPGMRRCSQIPGIPPNPAPPPRQILCNPSDLPFNPSDPKRNPSDPKRNPSDLLYLSHQSSAPVMTISCAGVFLMA